MLYIKCDNKTTLSELWITVYAGEWGMTLGGWSESTAIASHTLSPATWEDSSKTVIPC